MTLSLSPTILAAGVIPRDSFPGFLRLKYITIATLVLNVHMR